jgi:ubiquinone/menaquinone biosynthesis C-methylase UbiE
MNRRADIIEKAENLAQEAEKVPLHGYGVQARIQATLMVSHTLETIVRNMDNDPLPPLEKALDHARATIRASENILPELDDTISSSQLHKENNVEDKMVSVFENAWTSFSKGTYEHSVSLVTQRLKNSGYDETFFSGKVCFDGGCGSGRLSVALARMGAKEVVAVDLGKESIEYFRHILKELGISSVTLVEQDITNLSRWEDQSFDFVASNGVLHHTTNTLDGIREHFRITKPGGTFWLYLYGKGGIYWEVYDIMKRIVHLLSPEEIKGTLKNWNVREGMIYTYLDNLLAPRTYYHKEDIFEVLEPLGTFEWKHAKGMSEIDDTEILLSKKHACLIYGDQGETRIAIKKIS